jgi:hypothetical protein
MSFVVVVMIFAAAAYLTWTRSVAWAFALVYLPVMFLLSATRAIKLPLMPDMTSEFAVGYGVLAGLLARNQWGLLLPFKWGVLDTLVVALWLVSAASAGVTSGAALARNTIGDGFFDFLTPYFLARTAFTSGDGRRLAFWSCVA